MFFDTKKTKRDRLGFPVKKKQKPAAGGPTREMVEKIMRGENPVGNKVLNEKPREKPPMPWWHPNAPLEK
jgi:hypothetical protein